MFRTEHFFSILGRLVLCVGAAVVLVSCAAVDSPLSPRGPQRRIYLGPTVALGINGVGGTFHSQSPNGSDCNGFTGGSSVGFGAGLAMEYWFAQSLVSNGIVARIMYQQMPSTFTNDYGSVPFWNPQLQKAESVRETHDATVDYSLINIRLAYLYSIPATAFGLEIGPSIGIASGLNIKQTLKIDEAVSPGVTFADGTTSQEIYNGSPTTKNGIRFGLWVGGQYKFDVGWWIISPYVGYDIGFTKVLSTDSWSVSSIVAGLDFKYGIK